MTNTKLIILVGQCGCQIGTHILEDISNGYEEELFFENGNFSGIFIDMDRKICLNLSKKCVAKENIIHQSTPATGPWSCGYSCESLITEVWSLLYYKYRRKKEFVIIHSMIGATGGGFTSRLMEKIKTEFENVSCISFCVKPFQSGESSFQFYNTLLTMYWLDRFCDLVLMIDNDLCLKRISTRDNRQPSLYDMNKYIAHCILSIMKPCSKLLTKQFDLSSKRPQSDTLHSHHSKKDYSLSRIKSADISTLNHSFKSAVQFSRYHEELVTSKQITRNRTKQKDIFLDVLKELSSCKFYDLDFLFEESATRAIDVHKKLSYLKSNSLESLTLLASGKHSLCNKKTDITQFLRHKLTLQSHCLLDVYNSTTLTSSVDKNFASITVCSVSQRFDDWVRNVLQKCEHMLSCNAFLHWFSKYGIHKDVFVEAFRNVSSLIK